MNTLSLCSPAGLVWCSSWLKKMLWRTGEPWWAPQTPTKRRRNPQILWEPALPPTSFTTRCTAPPTSSTRRRRSISSSVTSARKQCSPAMTGRPTQLRQVFLGCVCQLFPSVTPAGFKRVQLLLVCTENPNVAGNSLQLLFMAVMMNAANWSCCCCFQKKNKTYQRIEIQNPQMLTVLKTNSMKVCTEEKENFRDSKVCIIDWAAKGPMQDPTGCTGTRSLEINLRINRVQKLKLLPMKVLVSKDVGPKSVVSLIGKINMPQHYFHCWICCSTRIQLNFSLFFQSLLLFPVHHWYFNCVSCLGIKWDKVEVKFNLQQLWSLGGCDCI